MKLHYGCSDLKLNNCAVTIGKFDGLHLGHQELIKELERAEAEGMTTCMITFELTGDDIYDDPTRIALLNMRGPEHLVMFRFDKKFASLSAECFVHEILIDRLGVKRVIVGDDFRFGAGRRGDAAFLKEEGELFGFETVVIDRLMSDGEVISSTLIRKLMEDNETERAKKLLNKEFFVQQ